jgi:hypothetical protein
MNCRGVSGHSSPDSSRTRRSPGPCARGPPRPGWSYLALLVQLEAACTAADNLAEAVEEAFPQHPDAEIILSFPGVGIQLGARVLSELGDDRTRFADARGLKVYAGSSPVTRASGKKSSVTRRWVKNDRLNHAGSLWAFSAITASPGARFTTGAAATTTGTGTRPLNRMIGQLYHCLQHGRRLDEAVAFPVPASAVAQVA